MEKVKELLVLNKEKSAETVSEEVAFADGLCFNKLVWIFLISCVCGFVVETLWCYLRHGYIESRKSLVYGPLSVAYGMGGVVLTLALYKVKDANMMKIFGISFLVGTVTEYICSLGQEIVFGSVAWDYSNRPFNINGRVCLLYSIYWGLLGICWIKLIYPLMSDLIEKMPSDIGTILTWSFIAFFIFDASISAAAGIRMDKRAQGIQPQNFVEEYLDNHFDDDRMHRIYANSQSAK
ncbi:MAG: putative ABC transporter permease [Faecalibacterium sp.]|nr:putative ABC transporter permease [Ruminococcus sp.]MCM1392196.1 putative ABC transporter permease [Ruminococcus sp.]MCM1485394.1 putative ABC transporter permease [Faecalibacterium sp.]